MGKPSATKNASTQEICLDLPGETVSCWRSSDKIRVVLRKHRDVIFDIALGDGKSYSVSSEVSDFYNADSKKLIESKLKGSVSFNDGQRLHLWVARSFKGHLVLKCNGEVMMKFEPNKVDPSEYDENPKTKPAPIIIALGGNSASTIPRLRLPSVASAKSLPPLAHPSSARVDEQCQVICVVEGALKGAPQHIADSFAKGGGKSGLADIDPFEVATRNWILGQLAGAAAYVKDNWEWLRASLDGKTHLGLKLVKAKVHFVRGKLRFYFSGYSKFNTVFGAGGFGPGNERILSIFGGAGKASSSFKSMANGVLGTLKGNALVAFIFSSATAMAEWKADKARDGYDFTASLMTSLLKSMLVAALTAAIVAAVVLIVMVGFGVSLGVLGIGAFTVGVGLALGYAVDVADKGLGKLITGDSDNEDGLSAVLAPYLRTAGERVRENWGHLMKKYVRDYTEAVF